MEEVNLGLIIKLAWKLLSLSDSTWVAQLQGKYLLSSSFLSPLPILLPPGFGEASSLLCQLFSKVPAILSTLIQPSLYGTLHGFLPSPLSNLLQSFLVFFKLLIW
jgi:hypothetical protein